MKVPDHRSCFRGLALDDILSSDHVLAHFGGGAGELIFAGPFRLNDADVYLCDSRVPRRVLPEGKPSWLFDPQVFEIPWRNRGEHMQVWVIVAALWAVLNFERPEIPQADSFYFS